MTIRQNLIHLVARVAVRALRPLLAKRVVDVFGSLLPPVPADEGTRLERELAGRGTCFTRALAISSRVRGSEVILGTDGPGGRPFVAHAWVENQGRVIAGAPPARHELTRLKAR